MNRSRKVEKESKKVFIKTGVLLLLFLITLFTQPLHAEEKSINPGINKNFVDPDVEDYLLKFENEKRSVFNKRHEIVESLNLKPNDRVADIGAGTGFFAFIMAEKVGAKGIVYARDISGKFVDYIKAKAKKNGIQNVNAMVNSDRSANLEENSVDVVFMCDTYHHFEYPVSMLESIRKSLKADGTLIVIDSERIAGKTKKFFWDMVRAGKGHFTDEIIDAGFELIEEIPSVMDDHYILRFRKRERKKDLLF